MSRYPDRLALEPTLMDCLLVPLALVGSWLPQDGAQSLHPLTKDRTGMQWVLPFAKAVQQAAETKRILMIKPVAFGTTPDGGW
jgi:hypothetical protein